MSKTLKSKRPKSLSKLKIPQFDDRPESVALLAAIQAALPELELLLGECDDHWGAEDHVYRFYYQSFKVYHLQDLTTKIAELLLTFSRSHVIKGCTRGSNRSWYAGPGRSSRRSTTSGG